MVESAKGTPSIGGTALADEHAPTEQISASDVLDMGTATDTSARGRSRSSRERTPTAREVEALVVGDTTRTEPAFDDPGTGRLPRRQRTSPPRVVKPRALKAKARARRQGDVAPFVAPPSRRTRRGRRRDYRRQGFIELTQEPQKRRHRILPRSVIGISVTMLALGVGAAFSGAALYAYYDYRLSENEVQVSNLVEGFEAEFSDAEVKITNLRDDSIESINDSLEPLGHYAEIETSMVALSEDLAPSVWFVSTLDSQGKPSVGSAFVVQSDREETMLLTSYSVVRQATTDPAPPVILEFAGEEIEGDVYTWDEKRDLALVIIPKGNIKSLEWAPNESNARAVGRPLYAVSGLGAAGASVSPGRVTDNSFDGVQHTATLGDAYRGGPLVNKEGQVVAIGTLDYQPLGFDPGAVQFAPHVSSACELVLTCSTEAWNSGGPRLSDASGNGAEPTETDTEPPAAVED